MSLNNRVADNDANHYAVTRSRGPLGLLHPPVVTFPPINTALGGYLSFSDMHETINIFGGTSCYWDGPLELIQAD